MKRDDQFVKSLLKGTKANKIPWVEVDKKLYSLFKESGEQVEKAFSFKTKEGNFVVVYKAAMLETNYDLDIDIEKANVHMVFTEVGNYRIAYKISDYDLHESFNLWSLYKLIQRNSSGVDKLMEDIMKDFDDILDF